LIGKSREGFLIEIGKIASEHPTASHFAFAYQLKTENGVDSYFNDDGEPNGTAGRPLLTIIESKHLVNSGLAVVRYYGGINLGTGGLTRAYSKAGMKAFTNSTLESYIHFSNYKLIINYNVLDKLINVIYRNKGTILDKIFADKVIVHISLPTKAEKIIREEFKMINMSLIN
tara:strand:- start:794 stop:1309 length:516 start_codon:yes stop_codon:yes gene_type:complete